MTDQVPAGRSTVQSVVRSAVSVLAVGLGLWIATVFYDRESPSPPEAASEPDADARSDESPSAPRLGSASSAATAEAPAEERGAALESAVTTSTYAETVRLSLRAALETLDRSPTEGQLDQMTQAVLRMREARAALRAIRYEAGEGQDLRRLRDDIAQAGADFQSAAGMSLSELTERTTEGGITPSVTDEGDGDDVVFEILPEGSK